VGNSLHSAIRVARFIAFWFILRSLLVCHEFVSSLIEPEMTDSPRRDSKRPPQVNQEMFARFLELLAPDPEEAGRSYTNLHKRLTGFFRMKGLTDPVSAADETLIGPS
jgi:hypothetical protein